MRFPGFIGPSYQLRSVNVECQRCINLYLEVDETRTEDDGEVMALNSTPGLLLLNAIGSGVVRGLYTATNGTLFAVIGNTVYTVTSAWIGTSIGTVGTSSGPVSMVDNGTTLVLVDGTVTGGWYTPIAAPALVQFTDPLFTGADQVTLGGGAFIFNKQNSFQYYLTESLTTTFYALGIGGKQSPDNLIGLVCDHTNLWLFGAQTMEAQYLSTTATTTNSNPYQFVQGSLSQVGCAAAFSIVQMGNTVLWLGTDKNGSILVYMLNGYAPQRISTHAIELAIQGYANISKAQAFCYSQYGHDFYVLNFPSANTTWVYDLATQAWHERVYLNNGQFQRHLAGSFAFAYGTLVVGDYQANNLYSLSITTYTDNGAAIVRQRISPHLTNQLDRIFYSSLELDMETGIGIDGLGQGTQPQVILAFSDDGGHTWSNEKYASLGQIGQVKLRPSFRRLGHSRRRVFKVTVTDPVKVIILGAEIEVEGGRS